KQQPNVFRLGSLLIQVNNCLQDFCGPVRGANGKNGFSSFQCEWHSPGNISAAQMVPCNLEVDCLVVLRVRCKQIGHSTMQMLAGRTRNCIVCLRPYQFISELKLPSNFPQVSFVTQS